LISLSLKCLAKGFGSEALAQKVCGRVVEALCMMVSVFCNQSMTFRKDIRPITGTGCRLVGSAQVTTLSHLSTDLGGDVVLWGFIGVSSWCVGQFRVKRRQFGVRTTANWVGGGPPTWPDDRGCRLWWWLLDLRTPIYIDCLDEWLDEWVDEWLDEW